MRQWTLVVLGALALLAGLAAWWWMSTPTVLATPVAPAAPVDARPQPLPKPEPPPPVPVASPAPGVGQAAPRPVPRPESPDPPAATQGVLAGDILDDQGQHVVGAWLVGDGPNCPRLHVAAGHFDVRTRPFSCDLYAQRMDGELPVRSDPVHVDLRAGEEADIQLVLPSARTGGLGIEFAQTRAGMVVLRVVSESPAEQAGLRAGDLIVRVDGESVTDMDRRDFQEAMTGPEGTDVHFVLRYRADDGQEVDEPIVVTRRFLPRPRRN